MNKADIVVIGSATMDMTAKSSLLPLPGQTVLGKLFVMGPGGKGANQAVAAQRLGGNVCFITKLGHDVNGELIEKKYKEEGMDTSHILYSETHSGVAMILVDEKGENCITMTPGANGDITVEDIDSVADIIKSAKFLVVQLEIPLKAVMRAVEIAHKAGVYVLLNPAPACDLPNEIYPNVSLMTPNETEAAFITGRPVTSDPDELKETVAILRNRGVKDIIITLGSNGSLVCEYGKEPILVPVIKTKALDTTGAGDTFSGAVCVALSEGKSLLEAAKFATRACGIAVQHMGAMAGIPKWSELE